MIRDMSAAPRTVGRNAVLIGAASGLGARDPRCGDGPYALRDNGAVARLSARGLRVSWRTILEPRRHTGRSRYRVIGELCNRLARETSTAIEAGDFPIVIGGDHSSAVGTWSGVSRALAPRGPVGLVWIDAHMDSHTPATSHSGMPHGMPLAALLGQGGCRRLAAQAMEGFPASLFSPERVCLVGVRSHEPEEEDLLERLGVRILRDAEVESVGVEAALRSAIQAAAAGSAAYGITLDLDAIDPRDAPGVGTPEPGGIRGGDLVPALRLCASDPRLAALEIAEYNPHRDIQGRTARLIEEILVAVLAGRVPAGAAAAATV